MDAILFALFASMALAAPEAPGTDKAARSGEQVVSYQCVLCHGPGMGGAPRIGDRRAWEKRLTAGEARLLRSVLEGRGAMPPNGGLADVSQQELQAAIDYMIRSSGAK